MIESKHIPGCGNANAKLLIVGEAPGATEEREGTPFIGPSGDFLWNICERVGFSRSEVWCTNVYKHRPPYNNIKRIGEVCDPEEDIRELWQEINSINPQCILALGDTALRTLRGHPGITKWRGSILKTKDGARKMVATIHPANIIRSSHDEVGKGFKNWPYIWAFIFEHDVKRAWEEAHNEDEPFRPLIRIARDSGDLHSFLSRNSHKEKMAADIESHNCVPICVGLAFDRYEALVVPLWNTLSGINISGISISEQIGIFHYLQRAILEKKIIGQNFKYDQDKLEMIGFEFNRTRPIWSDTYIKAHTLIPELPIKKMEMLQSLWTKLPYHKDEGKQFNLKKYNISRLFNYNGLDAISTFWTDEEMEADLIRLGEKTGTDQVSYFYNYRMLMHEIYLDMESIGFPVDREARKYLKNKYLTQHDLIQERIRQMSPDWRYSKGKDKKGKEKKFKMCHPEHHLNTSAPEQVKAFTYGYLDCPRRYSRNERGEQVLKSDEDTLVQISNTGVKDARRRSLLADIIEDRRVRKTLGTYVLAKTDYDGRIRGTYKIFGPETSRSATQILQPPIRPFKSGHAFQTLTKHGSIGADIRLIYKVDTGFVYVQADLSQAEPRIVAHLSEDEELLRAFESGKVDIHRRTAAMALGFTSSLVLEETFIEVADTLPKDGPQRFIGKKVRNGGNYNMQGGELAKNVNSDAKRFGIGLVVSEWAASKMVERFHAASPKIKEVFHAQIIDAINSTRTLVTPYDGVRQFFGRLDNQTYKEGFAHFPQKTVAEHVKHSLLGIRKDMPDMRFMLMGEAHDALLFRFPIGEEVDRARIVKKHFEAPIDFSNATLKRGLLRIPAEFDIGIANYKELKDLVV